MATTWARGPKLWEPKIKMRDLTGIGDTLDKGLEEESRIGFSLPLVTERMVVSFPELFMTKLRVRYYKGAFPFLAIHIQTQRKLGYFSS